MAALKESVPETCSKDYEAGDIVSQRESRWDVAEIMHGR